MTGKALFSQRHCRLISFTYFILTYPSVNVSVESGIRVVERLRTASVEFRESHFVFTVSRHITIEKCQNKEVEMLMCPAVYLVHLHVVF
jgi:hypothetical protein